MEILTFFAHPDDETMLCGGTMAILHNLGANIHYLCATRGEGGEAGSPPLCTSDNLGTTRSQELVCAVAALGGGRLDFLPYVDPRVGESDMLYPFTDQENELIKRLISILTVEKPDIVITHGSNGEYGHPAHLLCHRAMKTVVERLKKHKPFLYTFQAAFEGHPKPRIQNQDDPAHLVMDISTVFDKKLAATLCHRTQHTLFIRRPSEAAGRVVTIPEIILTLESLHRVFPPVVEGYLTDPLANLLKNSDTLIVYPR